MEIGHQINIDDENLITYFIEGLSGNSLNKSILCQSSTVKDLKIKIKILEIKRNKIKYNIHTVSEKVPQVSRRIFKEIDILEIKFWLWSIQGVMLV